MVEYILVPTDGGGMGTGMSHRAPGLLGPDVLGPDVLGPGVLGPGVAQRREVPRPQLAGALATALKATTVVEQVIATAATALATEVALCDQLGQLPATWRVALRRAESQATDKLGVGLSPGAAHRFDLDDGASVLVVHGDGWSLVGRTLAVLLFLLDTAPGLVIDLSRAEGATELVSGLADRLGRPA